jgi:hypothetical protein
MITTMTTVQRTSTQARLPTASLAFMTIGLHPTRVDSRMRTDRHKHTHRREREREREVDARRLWQPVDYTMR